VHAIDIVNALRLGPLGRLGPRSANQLAGMFGVVGSLHFVAPALFEATIPRALPQKRALVYISGVIEVACAAGLATRQRWAGPLSAVTLLAVWPANIQMAVDASAQHKPVPQQIGLWARVPLQLPMIATAIEAARDTNEG
jgi:uncharacterized membrane protein